MQHYNNKKYYTRVYFIFINIMIYCKLVSLLIALVP